MKFVTSLSLGRIDRQKFCLRSWQKYGLPICSVQCDTQIDELSKIFGEFEIDWTVIPAKPNPWNRPHLARVADHIKHTADGPILLINSDIEIKDQPADFARRWVDTDTESLLCGIRYDHPHGNYKSTVHPYGIDAFRITPAMAEAVTDDGFVIGSPGWDYWLPWRLNQAGFDVRREPSLFMHEIHEMGYGKDAVDISHAMMEDRFRVPPTVLTQWIQWATDRVGMKHPKRSRN
jgi:hypothetical protein